MFFCRVCVVVIAVVFCDFVFTRLKVKNMMTDGEVKMHSEKFYKISETANFFLKLSSRKHIVIYIAKWDRIKKPFNSLGAGIKTVQSGELLVSQIFNPF